MEHLATIDGPRDPHGRRYSLPALSRPVRARPGQRRSRHHLEPTSNGATAYPAASLTPRAGLARQI